MRTEISVMLQPGAVSTSLYHQCEHFMHISAIKFDTIMHFWIDTII